MTDKDNNMTADNVKIEDKFSGKDQNVFMFGQFDENVITALPVTDDTVTVSAERYAELIEAEAFLDALEAAGVDNWEGYDFAQEIFDAFNQSS